jgi:Putative Actinobacterial Holin-X, holin superfamily III
MTQDQQGSHYDEPTIGKLVADASRDVSTLIHDEIELAKSEIQASVRAGGMGAGFFGVAAFLALLAIVLLSISFAFFLTMTGLDPAWAFLIVFGVYLVVAAVFAYAGRRKLKQARPPKAAIAEANKTKQMLSRG